MKPASYYENLPNQLVDFSDPETPESVKIRARGELQNVQAAQLAERKSKQLSLTKDAFLSLISLVPKFFK